MSSRLVWYFLVSCFHFFLGLDLILVFEFWISFSGPVVAEAMFLNREEIPVYPIYRDPVSENTDEHVVFCFERWIFLWLIVFFCCFKDVIFYLDL
jgi:hypothetical protein